MHCSHLHLSKTLNGIIIMWINSGDSIWIWPWMLVLITASLLHHLSAAACTTSVHFNPTLSTFRVRFGVPLSDSLRDDHLPSPLVVSMPSPCSKAVHLFAKYSLSSTGIHTNVNPNFWRVGDPVTGQRQVVLVCLIGICCRTCWCI